MPYPPRPQPEPQKKTGFWSLLDGFTHAVNNPLLELGAENLEKGWKLGGAGLATVLTQLSGGGTGIGAAPYVVPNIARGRGVKQEDVSKFQQASTEKNPLNVTAPVGIAQQAMYVSDKAWDYGVNRPIGTAALLAKTDSPLFNGKKITEIDENGQPYEKDMGKGFQLSDIQDAFNRTDTVTAFQAIANSDVAKIPMIGGIAPLFNALGGVDKYDPWNDDDMEAAQSNPFYVAFTGGGDLALQLVLPPVARVARNTLMRSVGLTNTIRSAEELSQFRQAFNEHTPTERNTWGDIVDRVTNEKNPLKIQTLSVVANNVGANKWKLSKVLAEATDRSTVNEILLANMGDAQAIVNLAHAAPDIVWRLGDVDELLASNAAQGVQFRPTGPMLGKVNEVFDSALKRNQFFGALKDDLVSPTTEEFTLNSTWRPTSSMTVEAVRNKATGIGYAVKTGDWSHAPQWMAKRFDSGNGSLVTSKFQWVGSRSPLNHVSNSGARPEEKLAELRAGHDAVPFLRGNRPITYNGKTMTANEWRAGTEKYILDRTDGELPDAWLQQENAIIDMAADMYGVERVDAHKAANAYRSLINDSMSYIRQTNGYLYDAKIGGNGRVIIDPQTLQQMLSSFQTLPMAEVIKVIKDEGSNWSKVVDKGQDKSIAIYDSILKVFRTDVLFRPGYTGKNSILEPLMARYMAHGTILTDEGLMATLGNFTVNNVRRIQRVAYYSQLHKVFDKSLRTGKLNAEAKNLVQQRHDLQQQLDGMVSEIDHMNRVDSNPALKGMYTDEIRGLMVDAKVRMDWIDKTLDGMVPEWRQVVEPATQADLRSKLMEFRAILGENPGYVPSLEAQAMQIESAALDRARGGTSASRGKAVELERLLERERATEGHTPDPVKIAAMEKEIAAIRGKAKAQKTSPDITYTKAEQAELDRIHAIIDRIETHAGKDTSGIRSTVEALQEKYDEIVTLRHDFVPRDYNVKLQDLEAEMKKLDSMIAYVKGESSVRTGRWRAKMAKAGAQGYRGSGRGMTHTSIGGETFEFPSAFSRRPFAQGAGYEAEASAQTTNQLTWDPSRRGNYEAGRWRRANMGDALEPNTPMYWDAVAYTGNRYFRNDRMIQKHLSGWSRERIAIWLKSDEGDVYMKAMGKDYLKPQTKQSFDAHATGFDVVDDVDDSIWQTPDVEKATKQEAMTTQLDEVLRIVDQYFPDKQVQRTLAERDLSAGEIQAAMGARSDLSKVIGDDLAYHPTVTQKVTVPLTAALDKAWQWIATGPEDRVARWPFFQTEFKRQMTNRGTILHQQGVKMTDAQWETIRQASYRASLKELEKTFYNIRRYSTPVYASRFLMTFPGAFFNSIYRYSRFMVREPERTLQLALLGADIIKWGGVDENGDHVEDLRDAKYFLIPGTKSEDSEGMRLPINSLVNFTVSYPSLSVGALLASSLSQRTFVKTADTMRRVMGDAWFAEEFPYGVSDNPVSAIMGAWQKDGWRVLRGPEDIDVKKAVAQTFAYNMYQWDESGHPGREPTIDDAINEVAGYYARSTIEKFLSPFAVTNSPPGALAQQAWSEMQQKYPGDTDKAREAFIAKYGDISQWEPSHDPTRWLTHGTSQRTSYIPATMAAYDRIWTEYPDLAKDLVAIDPQKPDFVGLLAYGAGGEYSAYVMDKMQTTPLPGDDTPVLDNLDPLEYEARTRSSEGWDQYMKGKTLHDAEHLRLSTMRDEATSEFERQHYRDQINGLDTEWKGWVTSLEASNIDWAKQKTSTGGDDAAAATIYLNKILTDPEFAKGAGKSPAWQKVGNFLKQRETAKTAYAGAEKNEEKQAIKAAFTDYITKNFVENDADFAGLWTRYFANEWDVTQ